MFNLVVNGESFYTDAEADTPLLWVIREELGLSGTKFGCGKGICGACSIHINGEAIRSCQIRVEDAVGKTITTIEGLGAKKLHPVQEACLDLQVPQCGYCQAGQIMTAAALLKQNPNIKFHALCLSLYTTPIYSRSLERKNLQAFCLLQIFFFGIRAT